METVQQILHSFRIKPLVIKEVTDRLQQIDDGKQLYALKRTEMTEEAANMLTYTYQKAQEKQLRAMLPLYLTDSNTLFTYVNDSYYYLTPWVPSNVIPLKKALQTIGKVHQKTTKTYEMAYESFRDDWKTYQTDCQALAKKHVSYIEHFEQVHHMSPLGLQVCTHFHQIQALFKMLHEQIEQLLEAASKETEASYCLCHGQLTSAHFIGQENIFITNWEHARLAEATGDVASMLQHDVVHINNKLDLYKDAFTSYMKENELTSQALYLLMIDLLDPSDYMTRIKHAIQKPKEPSMIKQVQALEQQYRQLIFGLHMSRYIQETYLSPSLDDLDLNDDA